MVTPGLKPCNSHAQRGPEGPLFHQHLYFTLSFAQKIYGSRFAQNLRSRLAHKFTLPLAQKKRGCACHLASSKKETTTFAAYVVASFTDSASSSANAGLRMTIFPLSKRCFNLRRSASRMVSAPPPNSSATKRPSIPAGGR